MPKAQRYTMEQIQAVLKKLRALPVKNTGKTKAEAVEILSGSIRKAMKQGYSLKEIHDILTQGGVPVSLSRMKAVLGQAEEVPAPKGADVFQQEVIRNESEAEQRTAKLPNAFSDSELLQYSCSDAPIGDIHVHRPQMICAGSTAVLSRLAKQPVRAWP